MATATNNKNPFETGSNNLTDNIAKNWKTLTAILVGLAVVIGGFFLLQGFIKNSTGLASYTKAENMIRPTNFSKGKKDASLQFVYAFDFLCPACQSNTPNMKQLVDKYDTKVNFVFKTFVVHAGTGDNAARAAQAAGKQGKYYEYYDKLINKIISGGGSSSFSNVLLENVASEIGLDIAKWNNDRGSAEVEQEIAFDQKDIKEANFEKADANGGRKPSGTPSVILVKDGKVADWWTGIKSVEEISTIIDEKI